MRAPALKVGQVATLSRTLPLAPDPVALYAATIGPDTLLLESADRSRGAGKSLVMTRAAVRLRCRGRRVEIAALTDNGRGLLPHLARRLAGRAELCRDGTVATFAPLASGRSETARLTDPSPLDVARALVLDLELVGGERSLPPLVAGSWAYDLLGCYEDLPAPTHDPTGWPDYELWLAEELVWIEHASHKCTVLAYVFGGASAETSYHDAQRSLAELVRRCQELGSYTPAPVAPLGRIETDMSDEAYADLVVRLKEHIVRGDVFQIVPSRTFSLPCSAPLDAYARLRALNPSPYMFYLASESGTLFGASPESALKVDGEPRRVSVNPIAGTRRRALLPDGSVDHDLDSRIEAELRLDEKEVAEHMMLVDLARNDVARVSRPGTRRVDELMQVVRYSHVMHLVSLVSGELREGLDPLHAYVATMNMGTLVGAPKLKAAEILRRYEPSRRGPYGGAVGYLTADGRLDSCIVIRSALVKDGVAHVRAGAGVVHDSVPASEADETRRKAGAVLCAIGGGS